MRSDRNRAHHDGQPLSDRRAIRYCKQMVSSTPTKAGQSIRAPAQAPRMVSTVYSQAAMVFGLRHGLDPESLCRAAGVPMSALSDRDGHISARWGTSMFEALRDQLPEVDVGIEMGLSTRIEFLGYLGQALRHCPTALETLRLLMRSARLLDSAYHHDSGLDVTVDHIELRCPALPDDPPEAIEFGFVNIIATIRELMQAPDLNPQEVRFLHQREPATQQRLHDVFHCPVRFGCPYPAMRFDHAFMRRPMPGADPQAARHFREYVGRRMRDQRQPLSALVTQVIEHHLENGKASQAQTAATLGMGVRSLQRALRRDGTSYQDLLAQARLRAAQRLLGDPALAIYEVALALGYDDVSAFHRAFRKWTGKSPGAFRAALTG